MINALLLLSLLCQDPEVSVNGRGRRQDGEYELTVSGKGKGLRDQEIVTLKFRRFENRVAWDDRVLTTQPVDDEAARTAVVEKQEFVHQEKFPTAGEVEVVLRLGRPEDGASEARTIQRIFRIASPTETAHAIGADAKGFDAALRGVRSLLEDLEALKREEALPMKRQGRLQKRIDWRKNAYRANIARSFLTASARALGLWMEDVENASELERAGKEPGAMVSLLTGKPFSWAEARSLLAAIEAVSLRERALLIVREVEDFGRDVAASAQAGNAAQWGRLAKEFERVADALQENDQAFRSAPSGPQYAALADLEGVTVGDLLLQARQYLQAAADCVHCAPKAGGDFEELGRSLRNQASAFEVRIRGPH
jgi:hypothetical protein